MEPIEQDIDHWKWPYPGDAPREIGVSSAA
jgi:hypothetical protein